MFVMLSILLNTFIVIDSTNLFIESYNTDIQPYRLYLLIHLCKGFLMINKFKILLAFI